MDIQYLERLLEAIEPRREKEKQPESEIYALLDGARDPEIYPFLKRSAHDYRCLYSGDLSPKLTAAAPYLVWLPRSKSSRFTNELVEKSWGNSWGIFLESPAFITDLRKHFRQFLRVKDEEGRTLVFRYYDPRVMRLYLPTCNSDELRMLFGPVERFMMEGERADMMIEFRRKGPSLQVEEFKVRMTDITS